MAPLGGGEHGLVIFLTLKLDTHLLASESGTITKRERASSKSLISQGTSIRRSILLCHLENHPAEKELATAENL
jgi:hypothetical protein